MNKPANYRTESRKMVRGYGRRRGIRPKGVIRGKRGRMPPVGGGKNRSGEESFDLPFGAEYSGNIM
jgi:hypothetical protein